MRETDIQRYGLGPGGVCVCLKCGYSEPHQLAQPCTLKKCPRCGSNLIRK